uniref:BUD13 homolog n=1 Tax=Periophthalmus magnuspinnatus TaxID=409849 RepID=A0A3B3ZNM6_9GOBI
MAASVGTSKATELSKAEYLKRYLSGEDAKKSKGKVKKKRPKSFHTIASFFFLFTSQIAEVIDERPEEIKQLEVFRSSNRWKIIGETQNVLKSILLFSADENEGDEDGNEHKIENSESTASGRTRHDSPDISPPRHVRHDSPDASPPKRSRHDSPDISPPRRTQRECGSSQKHSPKNQRSSPGRKRHDSDSDQSPPRKKTVRREASDSDQSPPRHPSRVRQHSDSDQSPPRRRSRARQHSDSDQSPPRKRPQSRRSSDEDLSPPRRPGQSHRMLSGGKAGLVSVDVLRREQEENRRRDRNNQPLEDESRNAQTIFRDKSGKRRDLNSEREEQKKKAGEQAAKDEKYAQWGRGLAQGQMHQQRLEDALLESQKPLARHYDDEDLDKMLREQEREGDPMAAMLRRKKDRNLKAQGVKEKPRYKGPAPPPNRFNILPGYRWDGVDRSNGFEQKRYARMADKKAVQEEAYKWSVEDM